MSDKRQIASMILNAVQRTSVLSKEVNRVISIANKRYDRIKSAKNIVSPAVDALEKSGGRFHLRGYTWEQQKQEYFRAISFMNETTSTLGNARKFTNEAIEQIFNINVKKSKNKKAYYNYFKQIYYEYAEDIIEGDITELPRVGTDIIGQYFYDMRVQETRNRIESNTVELIRQQNASEREQANEIADNVIGILDSWSPKKL